eukprot:CAMPEP_0195056506 /NCGR_PEP_ID=MMETSP0448-20130528/4871_1 /TAXON_ID=66468 /ORGANISM="Heterocapsa triquestra, Strain CCMP 448" /LENGTH=74 /DNA_ID=CAMNT_0040086335 /DNA_START=66 /DNA_END=287 /DNA_ORIENTATION=+
MVSAAQAQGPPKHVPAGEGRSAPSTSIEERGTCPQRALQCKSFKGLLSDAKIREGAVPVKVGDWGATAEALQGC